jgi:hypothetical protein
LPKKKTHEQFIQEVYELVGNEYNILGEYNGNKTKILMKHNVCNNEFYITPDSFLHGRGCHICSRIRSTEKRTKTHEFYCNEVYNLVKDEYIVLDKYLNAHTKILMRHNTCGYEWYVLPNNILSGKRCPKCCKTFPYTNDSIKEKIYNIVGNEYSVMGNYCGMNNKTLMKHNICQHEWGVTLAHFINGGTRCPKCFGNTPYTKETFKEKMHELVKDEYELISDCRNNRDKIKIRHNICKYEWEVSPASFLSGRRCPECNASRGEKKIKKILDYNNINYQPQYTFDDLMSNLGNLLRFDFGILNKNNDLEHLIEYNGEQHYEWFPTWMTKEKYETIQYHDKLKYNYCENNDIPLLRIPYWDFDNVENILEEYILDNAIDICYNLL